MWRSAHSNRVLLLLSAVVLLSACWSRSRLNGTYTARNAAGEMSYTFKSNAKVNASFMGREYEGNYEIEGNRVKITGLPGEGTQVLTLLEDGSIQGMGMRFTKQDGSRLDGKYVNQSAEGSYTFQSNGKVTISVTSAGYPAYEGHYEVDGNKVKIMAGNLNQVMTLLEDGSIQSPMGVKFTKQKK